MNYLVIDRNLNYKHYGKDVGMIPYMLSKQFKINAAIVGTKKVSNYKKIYEDYNVKTIIPAPVLKNTILGVVKYIWNYAKQYDVLNLYHFDTKVNYLFACIYKIRNPKGIIYIKLDMGYRGVEQCRNTSKVKHLFKKIYLDMADIVSDENSEVCKQLEMLYKRDIFYLPNGWYSEDEIQQNYCRNEDIIFVGRVGIKEKGVDLLLDAFLQCKTNAKLKIVGKIEDSYKATIEEYKNKFNANGKKVEFLGEIRDKKQLGKLYDNSSILVVPSRWESFGIVMAEGLAHGCFIVASDKVSSAHDIIDNSTGLIFRSENIEDLTRAIDKASVMKINRKNIYKKSKTYEWKHIIDNLYNKLTSVKKD